MEFKIRYVNILIIVIPLKAPETDDSSVWYFPNVGPTFPPTGSPGAILALLCEIGQPSFSPDRKFDAKATTRHQIWGSGLMFASAKNPILGTTFGR